MKNIIIKSLMFTGVFALLFTACTEDYPERTPSPLTSADCIEVYFPAPNETTYELELAVASVPVTIARLDSTAAATVPITVLRNDSDIFVLPATVAFAAGQAKTTFNVTYPNAELAVSYTFEIKVEGDDFANAYKNVPTKSVTISRIKWNKVAEGTFTSGFFVQSWPQDLYRAQGTNKYRLFDLWVAGYNYNFTWAGGVSLTPGGTVNASGYYVNVSGYVDPTYGMVSTQTDADPSYTYYNAETTTFNFNMKWYVPAGSFGWKDEALVITNWLQ